MDKTHYFPPNIERTKAIALVQPAVPIRVALVVVNEGQVDVVEEPFLGLLVHATDQYEHTSVRVGTNPQYPRTPAPADVRGTGWKWDAGAFQMKVQLLVWSDQWDAPEAVDGHEVIGNCKRIAGPATESAERWRQRIDEAVQHLRTDKPQQ